MKPLRILHAPVATAGQPAILSRTLRQLGHLADSLIFEDHYTGYPFDINLNVGATTPRATRLYRKARFFFASLAQYDVYHFHFGSSLLPGYLDLPILRRLGKTIVAHFHGCDVRGRVFNLRHYPSSACHECPGGCVPAQQQRWLAAAQTYAHLRLVSTPDLIEFVPHSIYLPTAVDLAEWKPVVASQSSTPVLRIVHAPTHRQIKGTRYVEMAMQKLQAQNANVEWNFLERLSNVQMRAAMQQADIVVDQVLAGVYGVTAIESMALGKPTVAYIREDFKQWYPDLPIVSGQPDNLLAVLSELVADAALRRRLGEAGQAYVQRVHNALRVSERLLALYMSQGNDVA